MIWLWKFLFWINLWMNMKCWLCIQDWAFYQITYPALYLEVYPLFYAVTHSVPNLIPIQYVLQFAHLWCTFNLCITAFPTYAFFNSNLVIQPSVNSFSRYMYFFSYIFADFLKIKMNVFWWHNIQAFKTEYNSRNLFEWNCSVCWFINNELLIPSLGLLVSETWEITIFFQ